MSEQMQHVEEPPEERNLRTYAEGEFIFQEGDPGQYAYVVAEGSVEICKQSGGDWISLKVLNKGDLFGEMALIDRADRSASARAKTDAFIQEVDQQAFLDYIKREPDTAFSVMHQLAQYVRTSNKKLEASVFDKPTEEIEEISQKPSTSVFDLNFLQSDKDNIINEFQKGVQEVEAIPFSPAVFWSAISIVGLFFSIVLWSTLSVIDTTVSTRGRLTTTVPTIEVQSTGSANVKAIHAEIGKIVSKGDILIELDTTFAEADLSRVKKDLHQAKAEIQRLQAELMQEGPGAVVQIENEIQKDIFLNRNKEYESRIRSFDQDLNSLTTRLTSAKADAKLAERQLEIKEQLEDAQKTLYDKRVGSIVRYLGAQNDSLNARRDFNGLTNEISSLEGQIKSISADRQAFVSNWFGAIGKNLSATTQKRDSLKEELVKVQRNKDNVTIVAPADGVIIDMENIYVGGVVNSGGAIMTLVPSNVPLSIEMDIDPRDISNMFPGAEVSFKLDALPYQKHGDLQGKVTFISEDTVDQSLQGQSGAFYRAHANIEANELRDLPTDFRLVPGMLLRGDVKVGRRKLITYFIYPIIRTIDTSFREPS